MQKVFTYNRGEAVCPLQSAKGAGNVKHEIEEERVRIVALYSELDFARPPFAKAQLGVAFVLRCVLILLALSITTSGFAQQSSDQPEGGFLIQIRESQMDLSRNGVTFNNCMQVLPNGRFHLERRLQQLPATTASLNILDSSSISNNFKHSKASSTMRV